MQRILIMALLVSLTLLSCTQAPVASPATSLTASPPASTATPSPSTNQVTMPPTAQEDSITPYIASFEASPSEVQAGNPVTLRWSVNNATHISIDQGIGTVGDRGSRTVTPASSTAYTLTASNSHGSSTARVHVNVSGSIPEGPPATFNMPEVVVFSAEPANIVSEQEAILTWEVRNAYDVIIEPGLRIIPAKGTAKVSPSLTTTYKLTATNDQGTILAATTVTVSGKAPNEETPVIKFFKAEPCIIKKGESAVLSWKTVEASSVTIDKGVGIVSGEGTTSVSPQETTLYTMIAANPRGAQYQTVIVNVK